MITDVIDLVFIRGKLKSFGWRIANWFLLVHDIFGELVFCKGF